jgi:hypothetical protein
MVTKVLLFTGGVVVGLWAADIYAKWKIQSSIDSAITGVAGTGAFGQTLTGIANTVIVPSVQ